MAKKVCNYFIKLPDGTEKEFSKDELIAFLAKGGAEMLAKQAKKELPKSIFGEVNLSKSSSRKAELKQQIRVAKLIEKKETKEFKDEIKNLKETISSFMKGYIKEANKINTKEKRDKIKEHIRNVIIKQFLREVKMEGDVSDRIIRHLAFRAYKIYDDSSLDKFITYARKVIGDANFRAHVDSVLENRKAALKRRNYEMTDRVKAFLSVPLFDTIDNFVMTNEEFEKYAKAVEALNQAQPDHSKMFEILMDSDGNPTETLFDRVVFLKEEAWQEEQLHKVLKTLEKSNDLPQALVDLYKAAEMIKDVQSYLAFKKRLNAIKNLAEDLLEHGNLSEDDKVDLENIINALYDIENNGVAPNVNEAIKDFKANMVRNLSDQISEINPNEFNPVVSEAISKLKRLFKQHPDWVESLLPEDLAVLDTIIDRLENNFAPQKELFNILDKIEIIGQGRPGKLMDQLKSMPSKFKDSWKKISDVLALNSAHNYAGLLGISHSSALWNYVIHPTNQRVNALREKVSSLSKTYLNNSKITASPLSAKWKPVVLDTVPIKKEDKPKGILKKKFYSPDIVARHKAGMIGVILEHVANSKIDKYPLTDIIGSYLERDDHRITLSDRGNLTLIEHIYNELKKDYRTDEGGLDMEAMYNDYMKDPKSVFDPDSLRYYNAARDVFKETQHLTVAANANRGVNTILTSMYMPHSYLFNPSKDSKGDDRIDKKTQQIKLRAGSTYERISNVPNPDNVLEFDMDYLVVNHIEDVAKDYYINGRMRELRNLIHAIKSSQEATLDRVLLRTIINNERKRMEYELSVGNRFTNKLTSMASLNALTTPWRISAEILTNILQIPIRSMSVKGMLTDSRLNNKKYKDVIALMTKFNSTSLANAIGSNFTKVSLKKRIGLSKSSKLENVNAFINGLSGYLFTTSSWFPNFASKFEELTNLPWDNKYMNDDKFFYAIEEAVSHADEIVSSILGGSQKAEQRRKMKVGKWTIEADSTFGQILGYFQRFVYDDAKQIKIGFNELSNPETFDRGKARLLGAGTNYVAYSFFSVLTRLVWKYFNGDDDEKFDAKLELEKYKNPDDLSILSLYSFGDATLSFVTAGTHQLGRFSIGTALNFAYSSENVPEHIKKGYIVPLLERMYITPTNFKNDPKQFTSDIVRAIPSINVIYQAILTEGEALAGKKNVSLTSLIKRVTTEDTELDDEELEFKWDMMSALYSANVIMGLSTGNIIPGVDIIKKTVNKELRDTEFIGGESIYPRSFKPLKEVRIDVKDASDDENQELTNIATNNLEEFMVTNKDELLKMGESGKDKLDLHYVISVAVNNSKNKALESMYRKTGNVIFLEQLKKEPKEIEEKKSALRRLVDRDLELLLNQKSVRENYNELNSSTAKTRFKRYYRDKALHDELNLMSIKTEPLNPMEYGFKIIQENGRKKLIDATQNN